MKLAVCRPAHTLNVRDKKFINVYQKLGLDVLFLGNSRRCNEESAECFPCAHKYVGFGYPYLSKWVPIGTLGFNAGLTKHLGSTRPDIVHAGDLESLIGTLLYRMLFNKHCRIVYDIADTFSARYRIPGFLSLLIQGVDDVFARGCDEVILPQENRRQNFVISEPRKIVFILNCPSLCDAPPVLPLPDRQPLRIILSGYLTWTRGIREIVEAGKRANSVQFLAMGQYEKGVREYLINSGITECCPMSSQRDVLRLTTSCHLVAAFYNPDRKINRQAAPNKLYDAMAACRPLLINSEVEISRLVSDEWCCGYAVPFSDTERLAGLFNEISLNDEECRIRGENGRKLFETTYNWEAMERRISEMVGRLLSD